MRLFIAGVTGSIGQQALAVLDAVGGVEVVGMSAGSDFEGLARAAAATGCSRVALAAEQLNLAAEDIAVDELRIGASAAAELISDLEPDMVLNAVVGFAGLSVSIAALDCGATLALANKESLVAGGDLVMSLAEAAGVHVVPVDSEHASLAQLIGDVPTDEIASLTITASGGPFRGRTRSDLADVTVAQALAHPTWSMGGKISIDSATLMNKGLELIEAHHLFGFSYDRIGVVVHPQSIVHAMVQLVDGMALVHAGHPDMRSPIAWALGEGRRRALDIPRLDLAELGSLTFEHPDLEVFPALDLAVQAGRTGGTAPTVLNAANEVAVGAFLDGRIRFLSIPDVVAATLESVETGRAYNFDSIADADSRARIAAQKHAALMQ
jgi:1-deoxy-D-xylulose-5-phosphate reductoisomerase